MNSEVNTLASYNILILDDELSVLNALKRLISLPLVEVVCFDNPFEALEYLDSHPVQVIISDFRMPIMNGGDFLKRAKEIRPGAVSLILSGYTDSDILIDMINSKVAHKFLCKPWENDKLLAEVNAAIDVYNHNYFKTVLQEQLKKRDCPRVLINNEGLVVEDNLSHDIESQILAEFSACFSGNGIYHTPLGVLRCEIRSNPKDEEFYLITIEKVDVADEINIYEVINELLLCYSINPFLTYYALPTCELTSAKLAAAAHEVFRNYKILPSPTHHYLFVLDNIENSLLPRKQIELEIQLEKLLNTALPHEIQSNTIQLTEFLINGE
ncbi:response regulator [Pseudoalteromonas galatheae]|uniref:response regulator n=1 Tax=Pseudoalteromonas galatheae TaxID=579562 RepID=UPI0030D28ECD